MQERNKQREVQQDRELRLEVTGGKTNLFSSTEYIKLLY